MKAILFRIKDIFSLDLRSLAFFRVGIASILLIDLFQRAKYLETHYTDFGIMPRHAYLQDFVSKYAFSFHLVSGNFWIQVALFVVNALVACMLLVGFKTKLSTILSWVFLISLHNRNVLVLQGGDVLLRMFLFWSIFLPLGARFSFDHFLALKNKSPSFSNSSLAKKQNSLFSPGSIALVCQILILYFIAASHKISENWTKDFTAVYQALSADHFATPFGVWLRELRWPLPYLTQLTVYFEFALPFILICPFYFMYTRTLGVLISIGLHAGFASGLYVGLFWVIDIVGVCVLFPELFWRHMKNLFPKILWPERIAYGFFEKILIYKDKCSKFFYSWKIGKTLAGAFVFGNLIYVFAIVAQHAPGSEFKFPPKHFWYAKFAGLDQRWQMFSPNPMSNDGWFVAQGKLKDGTEVDVLTGKDGEVSWSKPDKLSATFVTQRWRKFFRQFYSSKKEAIRLNYARAVCRRWNRTEKENSKKLESFEVYYMLEKTLPNFKTAPIKKKMLWRHYCFSVPKDKK